MVCNTLNYWFCGLCPSFGTVNTRKCNVLETESVSVLRWGGRTPTLLGPLERDNLSHWTQQRRCLTPLT
jgi:hypothetical protein